MTPGDPIAASQVVRTRGVSGQTDNGRGIDKNRKRPASLFAGIRLSTSADDRAYGICGDGSAVYVMGDTLGSLSADPLEANKGASNAFVRKYLANGDLDPPVRHVRRRTCRRHLRQETFCALWHRNPGHPQDELYSPPTGAFTWVLRSLHNDGQLSVDLSGIGQRSEFCAAEAAWFSGLG